MTSVTVTIKRLHGGYTIHPDILPLDEETRQAIGRNVDYLIQAAKLLAEPRP